MKTANIQFYKQQENYACQSSMQPSYIQSTCSNDALIPRFFKRRNFMAGVEGIHAPSS
jgi:hypothetical protein